MRIDIHTHIVPDKVAEAAMKHVESVVRIKTVGPMTVSGVHAELDASGFDAAVVLAAVQDPSTVRKANDWAMKHNNQRTIVFGAMHPDFEDCRDEIKRLKDKGMKGLKLNPGYSRFFPDDKKVMCIYEEVGDDFIVLIHSGGLRFEGNDTIYALPAKIAKVADKFPNMKLIAAHFGGFLMLDEARKHIIGKKNIFLDTSWYPSVRTIGDPQVVVDIIRTHGANKILFGTDFPYSGQMGELEYFLSLPLTNEEKNMILGENAKCLLNL